MKHVENSEENMDVDIRLKGGYRNVHKRVIFGQASTEYSDLVF